MHLRRESGWPILVLSADCPFVLPDKSSCCWENNRMVHSIEWRNVASNLKTWNIWSKQESLSQMYLEQCGVQSSTLDLRPVSSPFIFARVVIKQLKIKSAEVWKRWNSSLDHFNEPRQHVVNTKVDQFNFWFQVHTHIQTIQSSDKKEWKNALPKCTIGSWHVMVRPISILVFRFCFPFHLFLFSFQVNSKPTDWVHPFLWWMIQWECSKSGFFCVNYKILLRKKQEFRKILGAILSERESLWIRK